MRQNKPQVNDIIPIHIKGELRIATKIACPTEQMIAKETSTLVADSLDDILQMSVLL